jgi:hypothetical protein
MFLSALVNERKGRRLHSCLKSGPASRMDGAETASKFGDLGGVQAVE